MSNENETLIESLEWRFRSNRKISGHLFDKRDIDPSSLCGSINAEQGVSIDALYRYLPAEDSGTRKKCVRCARKHELMLAADDVRRRGAFRLSREQRDNLMREIQAAMASNEPTRLYARSLLVSAVRFAEASGVSLEEIQQEAAKDFEEAVKSRAYDQAAGRFWQIWRAYESNVTPKLREAINGGPLGRAAGWRSSAEIVAEGACDEG